MTYTYKYTDEQGGLVDIEHGMKEPFMTRHPENGRPIQHIISGGTGVIYKGRGWTAPSTKKQAEFNVEWTE